MALSNAERQKKWLAKNRALHNLRRRSARKNLLSADCDRTSKPATLAADSISPAQSKQFETKRVGEFRILVLPPKSVDDEARMPVVKPLVFRDDGGRVISERAWNALQKLKNKAKEGGYDVDDYIQ